MIRSPAPSHGKGFFFRPRKHGVPFFEGNFQLPNHHQRTKNPEKSSNYTYLSSNNFLKTKKTAWWQKSVAISFFDKTPVKHNSPKNFTHNHCVSFSGCWQNSKLLKVHREVRWNDPRPAKKHGLGNSHSYLCMVWAWHFWSRILYWILNCKKNETEPWWCQVRSAYHPSTVYLHTWHSWFLLDQCR